METWTGLNKRWRGRSHLADKGTLLVDVVAGPRLSGDLEAKAGVADEPVLRGLQTALLVQVDGRLLLVSPLILVSHGGRFCNVSIEAPPPVGQH